MARGPPSPCFTQRGLTNAETSFRWAVRDGAATTTVARMSAIEVVDLHKSYGDFEAVRGVSFTIEPGEVVALLGPNGAGKSSVVEILEGHRSLTSGSVSVLGQDPHAAGPEFRDRVGIVLQETGVDQPMSVRETCLLYTSPSPRDKRQSRMPSSA